MLKSDRPSRVHRAGTMDVIAVKSYDAKGKVTGERRFAGLFTSSAYHTSPREIPLLIQHHPDVLVLAPNGPLRLFQIEQARHLKQVLGREPKVEEIAAAAGIAQSRLCAILKATPDAISLDTPVGESADTTIADMVKDETDHDEFDTVLQSLKKVCILDAVKTLTEPERTVLIKRFGLLDDEPLSHEETAAEMGLKRERVRALERSALAQLKKPELAERLQAYWD